MKGHHQLTLYKVVVIACKAQEEAGLGDLAGMTPVSHCLDPLGVSGDTRTRDDMAQVANFLSEEGTLFQLCLQSLLLQLLQHCLQPLKMM